MSLCKSVKSYSKLHHDLLMLHTIHFDVPARVLMHIKRVNNAERELVRLTLACEATRFFNRYDLAGRFELVEVEDEEFVDELSDRSRVLWSALLRQVMLLDDFEVVLEESVGLNHAEDLGLEASVAVGAAVVLASALL